MAGKRKPRARKSKRAQSKDFEGGLQRSDFRGGSNADLANAGFPVLNLKFDFISDGGRSCEKRECPEALFSICRRLSGVDAAWVSVHLVLSQRCTRDRKKIESRSKIPISLEIFNLAKVKISHCPKTFRIPHKTRALDDLVRLNDAFNLLCIWKIFKDTLPEGDLENCFQNFGPLGIEHAPKILRN